jgi:hypothetical protein
VYERLPRKPYELRDKATRNEAVRRSRQAQKREPSVYAVWFPAPRVLKVGFTAHAQDSIFMAVARRRAGQRGWDAKDSSCIWRRPGDVRAEAWIQSTLAFRWRAAFDQKIHRLCEWFAVPDLAVPEIAAVLGGIYDRMPEDLTGRLA